MMDTFLGGAFPSEMNLPTAFVRQPTCLMRRHHWVRHTDEGVSGLVPSAPHASEHEHHHWMAARTAGAVRGDRSAARGLEHRGRDVKLLRWGGKTTIKIGKYEASFLLKKNLKILNTLPRKGGVFQKLR